MGEKTIRQLRMMSYFIDAAQEIIEDEGIDAVTIRKVSQKAGYNSATLYNYFENLNHLTFFASMKYLQYYSMSLPSYIKETHDAKETYLNIWEAFCYNSFNKPQIYNAIFFNEYSESIDKIVEEYYEIYPANFDDNYGEVASMIMKGDIYDRNKVLLELCAKEGFIKEEDVDEINEISLLVYQGVLKRILNNLADDPVHTLVKKTLKYLKKVFEGYELNN